MFSGLALRRRKTAFLSVKASNAMAAASLVRQAAQPSSRDLGRRGEDACFAKQKFGGGKGEERRDSFCGVGRARYIQYHQRGEQRQPIRRSASRRPCAQRNATAPHGTQPNPIHRQAKATKPKEPSFLPSSVNVKLSMVSSSLASLAGLQH